MLSPILQHWGLQLAFDETQQAGERSVAIQGVRIPVNLRGRLSVSHDARCRVDGTALLATCRIGRGKAVVLADAAVFDGEDAGRAAVLRMLIDLASR